MSRRLFPWLAPLALVPSLAWADEPPVDPDRRELKIPAQRIRDRDIKLDGHVDEAAWRAITPLPPMIQASPSYGKPASHRTDVRFAYGEKGIYVSFECHDEHGHIVAPFFVRDQWVPSDYVYVDIDANGDETTGYRFLVTPSGAVQDAQIFRDTRVEPLWDGVWRWATHKRDDGWSAELLIPWSTLRFEAADVYTLGINAARYVNHEGEETRLSQAPQGVPGLMSTAADWTGVEGISPGLNVEMRPFTSGRFALQRPEGSLDRSWRALPNAGYDLKYGLTGNLTLDLSINPDFGQAEVDAAVLNLGPFEVFFPEKRQFFLESKEIFETRFQLFYSRRVGALPRPSDAELSQRTVFGQETTGSLVELDPATRILGAARVTGSLAPGWTIGMLTANTGPVYGVEAFPDGDESPVQVAPMSQWTVMRLRRQMDSQTYVGGILTNVVRFGDRPDAVAGGVDYEVRFRERWTSAAQVIGTHDGDRSGMGASVGVGRTGPNTAASVRGETLSPHANFNDVGFMQFADYAVGDADFSVFNAQPIGKVRNLSAGASTSWRTTYDGLVSRKLVMTNYALTTLKLWSFSTFLGGHLPELDPFETRGGMPYEVPFHWWTGFDVTSPSNRRYTFSAGANYGEQAGQPGPDARLSVNLRPVDRLQIGLRGDFNYSYGRPRWVTESDAGAPIFGRAEVTRTAFELRGTLGITPQLAISTYNQVLYATARHFAFLELLDPSTLVEVSAEPYGGVVDQGLTSLISNTILRWEYIPGSFLFAAFTHSTALSQNGMPVNFRPGAAFGNLAASGARHEDILFIKLVHLFAL